MNSGDFARRIVDNIILTPRQLDGSCEGKESVLLADIRPQTPICSGTVEWLQGLADGQRRLAVVLWWDDAGLRETRALQIGSLILVIFILVQFCHKNL